MKIRGSTVGTTMPRADWNQTDPKSAAYIHNKPEPVLATPQTLTDEQKAQARANIGAITAMATIKDGVLIVSPAIIENNI